MRVVIVGAGLAGLTAADVLSSAGVDVVVLEASERIGGRTFTRRAEFIDGQYAEAGAEWIDSVHVRIIALIERFGLALDSTATTWSTVRRWLHREGRLLGPNDLHDIDPDLADDLERFETFVAGVAAGITDPTRPDHHSDAAKYDAMSVADVIDALDLGALAQLFARRNMQGEFAAEPGEVSVLFIAQQRAVYAATDTEHGHVEARRLSGGVSALSIGLADAIRARCDDDVIRLGAAVTRVGADGDGVTVWTVSGDHRGDAVILACALPALRRIAIQPPLPAAMAAAVERLGYGTVTKTALQYPERVWPAGYATSAGEVQRVYEPTAGAQGRTGILMAYTGGDGGRALAARSEAERMDSIEQEERTMYPRLGRRLGGFSHAWSVEPGFGGSYAVYGPGDIGHCWHALRSPAGRLHLAGEHTATWTGYLEGAVESGETVAARILGTE